VSLTGLDGQTIGGAAQGVGTALFEESPYDDNGKPLASTLIDYVLPAPTELRVSASSIWRHPLPIPRTALKASAKAVQSLRRRHSSTP